MENNLRWQFTDIQPSKELCDEWDKLSENNPQSCASTYPIYALSAHFLLRDIKPLFAYAYANETLVCAIPLLLKTKKLCFLSSRVLQIVNHDHLDFYVIAGQSLSQPEGVILSLIQALPNQLEGWDYFQARNLYLGKRETIKHRLPFYQKQSAYFDLTGVESINDIVPKKLLKNINRLQNKITSDDQALRLQCFKSCEDVSVGFEDFIRLENSGWKGENKTSIGAREDTYRFFSTIWKTFAELGKARIYILYMNETAIAGSICFRHGSTIYLHKIAYSESLTQFGPGSILVRTILEEVLSNKSSSMVYLNTNPEWASRWHPEIKTLEAVESYNFTIRGQILKLCFSLYRLARRIKYLQKS